MILTTREELSWKERNFLLLGLKDAVVFFREKSGTGDRAGL